MIIIKTVLETPTKLLDLLFNIMDVFLQSFRHIPWTVRKIFNFPRGLFENFGEFGRNSISFLYILAKNTKFISQKVKQKLIYALQSLFFSRILSIRFIYKFRIRSDINRWKSPINLILSYFKAKKWNFRWKLSQLELWKKQ